MGVAATRLNHFLKLLLTNHFNLDSVMAWIRYVASSNRNLLA